MSIQSEINRIAGAKSDIADAIEDMGGTLSPGASIDDMAAGVRTIPQGTSDYTDLTNKPQINGNTLTGNKTGADLGLVDAVTGKQLSTEDYTTAEKTKLAGIEAQANKTVIDDTLTNTGEAADAKAVGDELNGVKNTLNSEIATRQTYVRPNLLDNWYFVGGGSQLGGGVFPINQRGQTIYNTASYGIDRWVVTNSSGKYSIELLSSGLKQTILTANNSRGMHQVIGTNIAGKTVTLSIVIAECTGKWRLLVRGNNMTTTQIEIVSAGLFEFSVTIPSDTSGVQIAVSSLSTDDAPAGSYIVIQAAKLELGSGQTLAHQENGVWVLNEIPDYGEQLLKCQRYFQTFRTQSLRPTYGEDCRPVMVTASPATGTITKGNVTYYTLSSEQ